MDRFEKKIRKRALFRLAGIFHLPAAELTEKHRFGVDLKPSFVSDFRRNELDRINDDIHDVANGDTIKEFKSGNLVVQTVGDYCDHMVRCSKFKLKDVKILLEIE